MDKVHIRIHTMLNRAKIYECEEWEIKNNYLYIKGINVSSGIKGTFVYPLHNIEHFNIVTGYDYIERT